MSLRRVVALGGPPGSGKSTAGRRVAEELGLDYRSAGEPFRAEARRRGLSLEEFGRYAEEHPEVDAELDRAMQALAEPGRLLDGRIQAALCRRHGVAVWAIAVTAAEPERARRLAGRDGGSADAALRGMRERERSERERYRRFYGIDVDREPADLTIDSTQLSPDSVARTIAEFLLRSGAA